VNGPRCCDLAPRYVEGIGQNRWPKTPFCCWAGRPLRLHWAPMRAPPSCRPCSSPNASAAMAGQRYPCDSPFKHGNAACLLAGRHAQFFESGAPPSAVVHQRGPRSWPDHRPWPGEGRTWLVCAVSSFSPDIRPGAIVTYAGWPDQNKPVRPQRCPPQRLNDSGGEFSTRAHSRAQNNQRADGCAVGADASRGAVPRQNTARHSPAGGRIMKGRA